MMRQKFISKGEHTKVYIWVLKEIFEGGILNPKYAAARESAKG
jgi:hypothetical protein